MFCYIGFKGGVIHIYIRYSQLRVFKIRLCVRCAHFLLLLKILVCVFKYVFFYCSYCCISSYSKAWPVFLAHVLFLGTFFYLCIYLVCRRVVQDTWSQAVNPQVKLEEMSDHESKFILSFFILTGDIADGNVT